MLRNRSRTVTTKQSLVTDHNTSQSSSTKQFFYYTRPISMISSFFNSSSRFKAFASKIVPFESDFALISPISILDSNPSILIDSNKKPFRCHESRNPKSPKFQSSQGGIGLADLVNSVLRDDNYTKPDNKRVLFGSKLRVQIPLPNPNIDLAESPQSAADFGTKKPKDLRYPRQGYGNSRVQTKLLTEIPLPHPNTESPEKSPADSVTQENENSRYPGQGYGNSRVQTKMWTECLSVSEMEMSEDYTCVTSHGRNSKTTHIFDNCVLLESHYSLSAAVPAGDGVRNYNSSANIDNFLSFCYTCKKNLDQEQDIYIYRGEKAFCSSECRYQEMLIDKMES